MKENKGVEKAKEKLEEISNDEVMQKIADWKESYYREQASIRTTGRKEGLEEGLKEGKKEEKLQIAKNLKKEVGVSNSLRVSLYFYNTESDIDALVELLKNKEKIMEEMI